jgi:hypothetical protein
VQKCKVWFFSESEQPSIEKQWLKTDVNVTKDGQKFIVLVVALVDYLVLKKLQYFHE